jgi:hypothetical protein
MADLLSILSDPNYVNANAATKAAIFDKFSALDKNFTGANPETQQAIRVKFGVAPVAAPELSMREKVMGAIETPFALGATLASGAIAPIAGIVGTLTSGKYGTQEGIRAGEEAAKSVMYQPRTQVARETLGAIGEFLQPITSALPPTLGATGTTINALAPAVATQANALARPAITQAVTPVRNAVANAMTREQKPGMVGMGAASTAEDLMRQQRLEQFGIRATAGERTKNLQQQQFESEVQRGALSGVSEKAKEDLAKEMGAFKVGQKQDILNQFERMTNEVGGTIDRSTPRALGKFVDDTVSKIYSEKFNAYKQKYKLADESGETLEQVPYQSLLDYINTKTPTRRKTLDPILDDVAESLAMNDPQKTGTISIRSLEDIYQQVGTAKDSPSAKPLKDLITQIGDGAGGKLYQEARQARAQLAREFEDVQRVDKLLGTKAGYKDRQVALDDVYNHIIVDGPLEEMRTVTSLLKKTPEGQKAYQELQGYTLQRMKDLLLKKGDESEAVRLNNFNNFVTQLDREDKLSYMFGKKGREEIVDLRDAIKDVLVKEPGAVNYSNTGGVVLRGLEKLQALRFPGAQSAAEIARTIEVKGKVKEALKQPNAMAPANKNALANKPVKIDLKGMAE